MRRGGGEERLAAACTSAASAALAAAGHLLGWAAHAEAALRTTVFVAAGKSVAESRLTRLRPAVLRRALVYRFGIKQAVQDDTALFSMGLIDSLNVIELVTFVEEQLGWSVPPREITLENFDSVGQILRFASRHADLLGNEK